jgi:hypothetical protein
VDTARNLSHLSATNPLNMRLNETVNALNKRLYKRKSLTTQKQQPQKLKFRAKALTQSSSEGRTRNLLH